MQKTLKSSMLFLALASGAGCASRPVSTTFEGRWTFVEMPGEPVKACLVEDDVAKLREILIRCKAAQ